MILGSVTGRWWQIMPHRHEPITGIHGHLVYRSLIHRWMCWHEPGNRNIHGFQLLLHPFFVRLKHQLLFTKLILLTLFFNKGLDQNQTNERATQLCSAGLTNLQAFYLFQKPLIHLRVLLRIRFQLLQSSDCITEYGRLVGFHRSSRFQNSTQF